MPQPLIDLIRPDVDAVAELYTPAPDGEQIAFVPRVASDAAKLRPTFSSLNPEP
jgi:hypothetical protein